MSPKNLRIIAREVGIQPSILGRLENECRMPDIYTLKRIASAFYLTIDEFLAKIEKNYRMLNSLTRTGGIGIKP